VTHPNAPAPAVPRSLTTLAQAAFLTVLPGGGQDRARSNAWAARSSDASLPRVHG